MSKISCKQFIRDTDEVIRAKQILLKEFDNIGIDGNTMLSILKIKAIRKNKENKMTERRVNPQKHVTEYTVPEIMAMDMAELRAIFVVPTNGAQISQLVKLTETEDMRRAVLALHFGFDEDKQKLPDTEENRAFIEAKVEAALTGTVEPTATTTTTTTAVVKPPLKEEMKAKKTTKKTKKTTAKKATVKRAAPPPAAVTKKEVPQPKYPTTTNEVDLDDILDGFADLFNRIENMSQDIMQIQQRLATMDDSTMARLGNIEQHLSNLTVLTEDTLLVAANIVNAYNPENVKNPKVLVKEARNLLALPEEDLLLGE